MCTYSVRLVLEGLYFIIFTITEHAVKLKVSSVTFQLEAGCVKVPVVSGGQFTRELLRISSSNVVRGGYLTKKALATPDVVKLLQREIFTRERPNHSAQCFACECQRIVSVKA